MPVTRRALSIYGSSSDSAGSTGTINPIVFSIDNSHTVAATDVTVCVVYARTDGGFSPPSGWNQIVYETAPTHDFYGRFWIGYYVGNFNGGQAGGFLTCTFNNTQTFAYLVGDAVVLAGCDTANPFPAVGRGLAQINSNVTTTNNSFPTVTSPRAGSHFLGIIGNAQSSAFISNLVNSTLVRQQASTVGSYIVESTSVGAGSVSGKTYSLSGQYLTNSLIAQPPNIAPNTPTNNTPGGDQPRSLTLSSTVTDPEGSNVYAQFQVSTDSTFGTIVGTGSGTFNGITVTSGSASTYALSGLAPNTTYYVRPRGIDTEGAASGYGPTTSFFTNRTPAVPVMNTSGAQAGVTPLLSASGTDPDGDNVRCYFQVSTNTAFTGVVFQGYGSTVGSGTASTLRSGQLNSSTTYYVRALTEDAYSRQSAYSGHTTITTPAALTATFNHTGGDQSFVVPTGVTSITVDMYGGQGGNSAFGTGYGSGGLGGRTQGSIAVTPGETLTVRVAGAGVPAGAGGFGGGGNMANIGGGATAGSGGGGSYLFRNGTTLLAAAGGGGGAGQSVDGQVTAINGGVGGGTTGGTGGAPYGGPSTGGTQSAGGTAGGAYLQGAHTNHADNGAGGGGYYGGGTYHQSLNHYSAGGGGSSLVPSGGSTTSGVRSGHGLITLTYSSFSDTANVAPSTPTALAPTGTLTTVAPLLTATVSDPDGGAVRAYFQVSTNSGFTGVVFQGYGSTVSSGTASTLRCSTLNSSQTYFVRALAEDPAAVQSAYSAGVSFTTPASITSTYGYTGGEQTFVVPAGVTSVTAECWGSRGVGISPGLGGYAKSVFAVTPGETLTIRVGGGTTQTGGGGTYNGGGGFNGGGATDVRRGGTALADRRVVAGGGGGGGSGTSQQGGAGGGLTGSNTPDPNGGRGGTQSAGGAGGVNSAGGFGSVDGNPGTLGVGGTGGGGANDGGGGYYGGGGGAYSADAGGPGVHIYGGGGGGSSYIEGTGSTTTAGVQNGNGQAVITYQRFDETANTAPSTPTLTAPVNNAKQRGAVTAAWSYSDPNGHEQGSYAFRRTKNAVNEWWNGTAWVGSETFVSTATKGIPFPSGAFAAGTYTLAVRVSDSLGTPSAAYSASVTLTMLSGLTMVV